MRDAVKVKKQENIAADDDGKFLDKLGEKRLELKKQRMRNLLKIAGLDEALYREIMLSLGYKNNKTQFLELAMILPYSEIRKLKEESLIEIALLHRGGFIDVGTKNFLPLQFDLSLRMDKSVWNYRGVRPANYPEKRIKNISNLLVQTCDVGIFEYFKEKIESSYIKQIKKEEVEKIVNKIISFDGAGKIRRVEIFFNILLPFFMVTFEEKGQIELVEFLENLYSNHPPLPDNSITKLMKKEILPNNSKLINSVKRYIGLIQLYYEKTKEQEDDNT